MNVVVVQGILSSDPRERALPSGTTLINWDVTTESPDGRLTVPVAWFDPPRGVAGRTAGDAVIVIGVVRRRFYRAGGGTASATEVVGERVASPGRLRSVERLRQVALERLGAL